MSSPPAERGLVHRPGVGTKPPERSGSRSLAHDPDTLFSANPCHVGGEYLVGVSVEVLAGAVVAHGGAWIGVAGGDLYVAQAHAGVEHRRDERLSQHVRMHPGHPDPGGGGEVFEPAGRGVPISCANGYALAAADPSAATTTLMWLSHCRYRRG